MRLCLRYAESSYYNDLFNQTKHSTFNLWKHLGPIVNPGKKSKGNVINKIIKNGQFFTDAHSIANAMNEHFCEIGKKLQDEIPDSGNTYRSYLPQRVTQTFYLTLVTPHELSREIEKITSS